MRSRKRQNYEQYGDLFFVTSTIAGFINLFESKSACEILINTLKFYQSRSDYRMLGYAIMPNHFHIVMKIKSDKSISLIIGNIKKYSAHQIVKYLENEGRSELLIMLRDAASKEPARDCRIWKPRFDCFVITKEDTLQQKLNYIHFNPVRANLVVKPEDWHYSSAGNYAGFSNNAIDIDVGWECIGYQFGRSKPLRFRHIKR
jgi:REP element-mobilizing transposase RayT